MDEKNESRVIQYFRTYVLENKEHICRQADEAKRILNDNYDGIYDFFYGVLEADVSFKVLRARRCQVLFLIFLPIILLENENEIYVRGTFISDHVSFKYKDKILENSGMIIDDIVIHGRGLQQLYESLDPNYTSEQITIHVFHQSRKATMKKELKDKITADMNVFDSEWKQLSSQFVNLIYACASPYISFVESYFDNGICVDQEKFKGDFWLIDNTNEYQKLQRENSVVAFEKEKIPSLFAQLSYDCCLRIYISRTIKRTTYIPYVFLKNMQTAFVKLFLKRICQKLPEEKTYHIRTDLMAEYTEAGIAYQMKLLTALLNHCYGLYLKNKYPEILSIALLNIGELQICYGEAIAMELYQLTYQDIQGIMEMDIGEVKEFVYSEDNELLQELQQISLSINKQEDFEYKEMPMRTKLQKYFYINGQIDERRAQKGELRKKGITLGTFYKEIMPEKKHELTVYQLNSWDSGIASCNIYADVNQILSSYVAAGEQSFRFVLEQHKQILREMIYAYNCPLWEATPVSGEEKARELYNNYIKQHENDKDIDLLKAFIEENKNDLEEWGIPEILTGEEI